MTTSWHYAAHVGWSGELRRGTTRNNAHQRGETRIKARERGTQRDNAPQRKARDIDRQ